MAKNLKVAYLKKLRDLETKNGYKVHLNQYLYGCSHGDEYPKLIKLIEETPEALKYSEVYYFKYYDGRGKYFYGEYSVPNNGDRVNIVSHIKTTELEANNRFNLNKLVALAEQL